MLEVLMMVTVLNTAVAVAALVLTVVQTDRRCGGKTVPYGGVAQGEAEQESPFKLDDKKMQEGISNLLGFQPGGGGDEE